MGPVYLATKKMWQARLGSALGWLAGLLTGFRLCPHDWRDFKQVSVFETDDCKLPIHTELCRKYRSFKM